MHLAIDIGGSYIRYEILESKTFGKIETSSITVEEFLDSSIKSFGIKKVGISIAGQVKDGYVVSSPNIELKHKNLSKYIHEKWGIQSIIENDLNMASLAEAKYWKVNNLVALYSGTGIGAGIVENSKIIKGTNSLAGEIGHIPYKNSPFKCGCGKNNCIELYASGSGIKKWMDYYGAELSSLKEIKDSKYSIIAEEYEEALIKASAIMVTLFNPSILVLGGGVIESNRYLIDVVKRELPKYSLKAPVDSLKVELTKLDNAPLKGIKIAMRVL